MTFNNDTHGGVTDEDIESFFATHPGLRPINPLNGANPDLPVQFASGQGRVMPPTTDDDLDPDTILQTVTDPVEPPEPTSPDEPTTEPEAEPGEGVDDDPESSAPQPEFIEFQGRQIPASQLAGLLALQENINTDPALRELISGHFVGRSTPQQPQPQQQPQPPTVPDGLDLDDPSIAGLWAIVQEQNAQIAQLNNGVQTTYNAHLQQERQNAQTVYNRAMHDFKAAHELTDEQASNLSQIAARLNVVPALLQGTDPLTGVPVRPDPLSAVSRALEIAYFMVPEYRDREFQRSVKLQQQDASRKKNLGAVGGSSGSVKRQTAPPRPGSPEAKQAMLAEVGQMMTGEWSGDN